MTTLREAAKRVLAEYDNDSVGFKLFGALEDLRAALAEPVEEPVAIVGTREDTWKGYEGQWLPPGPPIKTVHMLRDLPHGTLLYTAERKENNDA